MQNLGIKRSEPLLVKELSRGNLLAFNTLFKEYSGRLYRFAFGYLKSEVDAEGLVQDVFLKIWEKRAELKVELSFKSYLFTIAFNLIKKQFRTRAQLSEYLKSEINDDFDFQTTQKINYDSLYQYITDLANLLPAMRKLIFLKSRVEGLSVKEISKELKISHKTVENQLTEALRFIRKKIKQESLFIFLFLILSI